MHVVCQRNSVPYRAFTCKKLTSQQIPLSLPIFPWRQARRAIFEATVSSVILLAATPEASLAVAAGGPLQSHPNQVTQVAGFLGIGEEDIDKNSSDPFTLQGTTKKKYSVEELEGEKVVKRRPGITARSCIKIASTAQSAGSGKLDAPEKSICRSAEDRSSVKKACQMSCKSACEDSLEDFRVSTGGEFGLPPSKESLERPQKRCTRNCSYECQKEGSGYRFTVNSTT